MSAINLGQPENYFLLTKIISGCCTLMQGIIDNMFEVKEGCVFQTKKKNRPVSYTG